MQLNNTGNPRVLGSIVSVLIASVALAVASAVYAQSGLPPEARARVVIVEIERALAAKDEASALSKFNELSGLPRPAALYVTEAKLAGRAKDYTRSRKALDEYFKATPSTDRSYQEASEIYASLNSLEEKADTADWGAASASNSCEAYTEYLIRRNSKKRFLSQTAERFDALGCPRIDSEKLRSSMDYGTSMAFGSTLMAFNDEVMKVKVAKIAARSQSLASAAAATGIEGSWRYAGDSVKQGCGFPNGDTIKIVDGMLSMSRATEYRYYILDVRQNVIKIHQANLIDNAVNYQGGVGASTIQLTSRNRFKASYYPVNFVRCP